jgi:hypothetical protein
MVVESYVQYTSLFFAAIFLLYVDSQSLYFCLNNGITSGFYLKRHELGLPNCKVRRWLHEQLLGEGNIFSIMSNMEELVWRLSQE